MPSRTKKQAVAMRIAAAGKSNIGIPQKVGKDFVNADKKVGQFNLKREKRKSKR